MTDKYIFNQNGDSVFKKLDKKYTKHKKGYLILGPMAIGKTYWLDRQVPKKKKFNWLDQDEYLLKIGAINKSVWNNPNPNSINYKLQYMRTDYGTMLAKSLGYRMIGSNFLNIVPDAIVIIPKKIHDMFMETRQKNKKFIANIERVKNMLKIIAKDHKVPVFQSVEEAVFFLEKKK